MFSSANGLMVVSIVETCQEFKKSSLTKYNLPVLSEFSFEHTEYLQINMTICTNILILLPNNRKKHGKIGEKIFCSNLEITPLFLIPLM